MVLPEPEAELKSLREYASDWCGYILDQSDDVVESSCLGLRLDLRQIYEGVELPPPGGGRAAAV
jgi:hypothetical protein